MALLVAAFFGCPSATAQGGAEWAVDPTEAGPDLPAAGRSLFDFIAADGIPFPFEALVRKIERRIGCAKPGECMQGVLIPLGRSLQRTAAAPDFFASPRAVVAVTGEGRGPMYAKDRLYLGYQERSNLLEVVSYNEQAGRFEFQIVRDYRAGTQPTLVYAARNVCTACHQNHAPLFSRPVWDETNANPTVAAELARYASRMHGIEVRRGVDIPNAIDDATERANLISVTQRLWRDACDAECRVGAIDAAWRYRRSGGRELDDSSWRDRLAAGFRRRWPDGLAVPNPDIPNRDPFLHAAGRSGLPQAHVAAAFEPLSPRSPLEILHADDASLARRFVSGLAEMLSDADVKSVAEKSKGVAEKWEAKPGFEALAKLRVPSVATNRAEAPVRRGPEALTEPRPQGLGRPRAEALEKSAPERLGQLRPDAPTKPPLQALDRPVFSRALAREVMGMPAASCCGNTDRLPPPRVDEVRVVAPLEEAVSFVAACGSCHATPEVSPPNFLFGERERVQANLHQCAPRIYARLSMWEQTAKEREKVPMPPPLASQAGKPWVQAAPPASVKALRETVGEWMRAETGRAPNAAELLADGYERLRPCLLAAH